MTRDQLEHIIRAAAVIADDDTIVIVGSQSVLGLSSKSYQGTAGRSSRSFLTLSSLG